MNIPHHFYADDTQLYLSFDSGSVESLTNTVESMQSCVTAVKTWMNSMKLKLNDEKTEVLLISSPYFSRQLSLSEFKAGDTLVTPVTSVRNLGAIFDSKVCMKKHISSVCKSVSFHLRNIGRVRKYLSCKAVEMLVHSLVSSRIDYSNSLLYGTPDSDLKRLQRLFHIAARIILCTPVSNHITPLLLSLHWLPVKQRIVYKLMLMTYRALHGTAPDYICELLIPQTSARTLRSSSQNLLVVPKSKTKFGDRAFSRAAPFLWNSLPEAVKSSQNTAAFKNSLKTHLYSVAYKQYL